MGIDNIALLFPGDDAVESSRIVVDDLGDGKFTVTGPSPKLRLLGASFELNGVFATDNLDGTFTVSSE
jgi:hypothetical protein